MSSSLISVGSVGASVAAGVGASPAGGSAPKTLMDVFAALLGAAGIGCDDAAGAEITQTSTATLNGGKLPGSLGELVAGLLQSKPADTEPEGATDGPLAGLTDLLAKVELALEAGEVVDPELLKKLRESIDALAALIGIPVEATATVAAGATVSAEVTGSVPAATPDGEPSQPTQPQRPLEQVPQAQLAALADKLKQLAAKLGPTDNDLSQKLAALGDTLSALQTPAEDAPDPIMVKLATASAPSLAVPELKLPVNASLSAKKVGDPVSAPVADEVDVPADTDVADAPPKLQVKAEVKAEARVQVETVTASQEKRDTPAAPPAANSAPPADTTTTATAPAAAPAVTSHATVHGEVRAIHTAYQAPSPINLPQVAFEIVRHVQQGVSKFQIRLDPPEMGRVDVTLDMDKSGNVNARLTVEKVETLDLLQRDQRALERALAQAGLDAGKTNLEFSLRQNPFSKQDGGGQQPGGSPFGGDRPTLLAEAEVQPAVTLYRGTASPGGVNMFV